MDSDELKELSWDEDEGLKIIAREVRRLTGSKIGGELVRRMFKLVLHGTSEQTVIAAAKVLAPYVIPTPRESRNPNPFEPEPSEIGGQAVMVVPLAPQPDEQGLPVLRDDD